jgi:predicted Zn-dependent protease
MVLKKPINYLYKIWDKHINQNLSKPLRIVVILLLIWFCVLNLANPVSGKKDDRQLPPLQTYPLPVALENWISDDPDDYFSQIKLHGVGYLIWSDFPIKVYLQSPESDMSPSALSNFEQWQQAVKIAIKTWNPYLPMKEINSEAEADILIYRRRPQLKTEIDPETGLYKLPPIKAATTSIQFYLANDNPRSLKHRMTIEVNPHQTFDYLVSNITHELGHALGIWGHSENPDDVMYYAHTKDIPTLSVRDINTLKKIYQQSTRLGGQI